MKRYTAEELQEIIGYKDEYIEYLEIQLDNQKKRIKVLGKALVASQRDYEELKRSRRKK